MGKGTRQMDPPQPMENHGAFMEGRRYDEGISEV